MVLLLSSPVICSGSARPSRASRPSVTGTTKGSLVGWSGVAEERRYAAFLRAWTRKEACLKAWGLGLHLEPSQLQVGFSVDSASQPVIVQPPGGVAGSVLLRYDLALADNADAQAAVALGLAA